MITVFLPEQADEMLGCDLAPDRSKVPRAKVTLREAYPEMCPVPGQAWVYISDMSIDYPDEVMSKAAEVFKKYGAQKIWADILRSGRRLQRRHWYPKLHILDFRSILVTRLPLGPPRGH